MLPSEHQLTNNPFSHQQRNSINCVIKELFFCFNKENEPDSVPSPSLYNPFCITTILNTYCVYTFIVILFLSQILNTVLLQLQSFHFQYYKTTIHMSHVSTCLSRDFGRYIRMSQIPCTSQRYWRVRVIKQWRRLCAPQVEIR